MEGNAIFQELSIALKTNEKIERSNETSDKNLKMTPLGEMTALKGTKYADNRAKSGGPTPSRPHFRIDWRQLTYYPQEDKAALFFERLFRLNRAAHEQRRLLDLELSLELDDEQERERNHEEEEEAREMLAACDKQVGDCDETSDSLKEPSAGSAKLEAGQVFTGAKLHLPQSPAKLGPNYKSDTTTSCSQLNKRPVTRPILNSLDGCFKSGELSAILGPSGAGKSTFLSALFGNKQDSSYGQTRLTWLPENEHKPMLAETGAIGPCKAKQKLLPNYINAKRPLKIAALPQQDHLLNHLTVYETLMFASKIKNPHQARNTSFHIANVRRVAKMLKLSDCFETRCSRLSGGQYKRVSIGQELLSEPDVIILDEPTSGLDASTCLTTVRTLKSIALKHPISIILTIHQPDVDVFNLFDKVYVIAQGGLAIYEGPPGEVESTLAQVNLEMPSSNYNPARFIVENAFIADLETTIGGGGSVESAGQVARSVATATCTSSSSSGRGTSLNGDRTASGSEHDGALSDDDGPSERDEDEDENDDDGDNGDEGSEGAGRRSQNFLARSISSLTDALGVGSKQQTAKHVQMSPGALLAGFGGTKTPGGCKLRDSGRRPLLNIGFQTADGQLITSDMLSTAASEKRAVEQPILRQTFQAEEPKLECRLRRRQLAERVRLLRRLNEIQKQRYYANAIDKAASSQLEPSADDGDGGGLKQRPLSVDSRATLPASSAISTAGSAETTSGGWPASETGEGGNIKESSHFIVDLAPLEHGHGGCIEKLGSAVNTSAASPASSSFSSPWSSVPASPSPDPHQKRRLRQFDKRLNAKHAQSKQSDYPIWYHSCVLTHRTWLSIVRDPIFFGIQLAMHTTIPILLGWIFGSKQEEGCPQVGNFDLVQFAYSAQATATSGAMGPLFQTQQGNNPLATSLLNESAHHDHQPITTAITDRSTASANNANGNFNDDLIGASMRSIRGSIGNIGIIFFEMFVLSFAINCITALVFPLDMHVLLKEYRNGWYSLRSYFIGRTFADLPVPLVLHSIAIIILYYLTGQPASWWRLLSVVGLVVLASLISQSVGLTVGAILMRSSQSAVLVAAGIVAPFFAISGFIVRVHTLPWAAQLAASSSYLYHLLNGFIIVRYGFSRCPCDEADFDMEPAHSIPHNIRTMASIWIGTYSNEFPAAVAGATAPSQNKTNVDPNIDVIEKLMSAFKQASSFGHKVETCNDVMPYAMLDFNLRDSDIWHCCLSLVVMLIVSRFVTFSAIYYKVRSFA